MPADPSSTDVRSMTITSSPPRTRRAHQHCVGGHIYHAKNNKGENLYPRKIIRKVIPRQMIIVLNVAKFVRPDSQSFYDGIIATHVIE